MGKVGRPKIVIDWGEVEKLLGLQCTSEEIAGFLGIDNATLTRAIKAEYNMNFAEFSAQKGHSGKISLRRRQWKSSENSVPMQIWLGKQWLKQRDKQEVSGPDGSPIQTQEVSPIDRLRDKIETIAGREVSGSDES